jgi:methionyl-tRNA formyltransferase
MVTTSRLRIVFFGTPRFAVPTLDALLSSRHSVVAVVTQPDRPRGRGQRVSDSPVKARAMQASIPVLQPERLRDAAFQESIRAFDSDLGVVAAYGRILPESLLTLPRLGMINVHASLLPKYRGAAPVHRAILAGERETGVTIMRVVKQLDAGPMLAEVRRPIGLDETSDDVECGLAVDGARLLVQVVDSLSAGALVETPQDETLATYAPRLTREDGAIDWAVDAMEIHNQVRGLHPWPHAHTFLIGRRLILRRTRVDEPSAGAFARHAPQPTLPGTILAATGDDLIVQAGDEPLRIVELQLEGKRPMTAREFLAGHGVAIGARLGSG